MADFPRASDRQDTREHKEVLDGIADVLTGARAANLSINGILTLLGLIFSGTARRITGDFHNATVANRVQFQDATAGAATIVGAIPNGTGTITGLTLANASDPDNAGLLLLLATTTKMSVLAAKTGTGTYLPLALNTSGTDQVTIDAAGLVTIAGDIAWTGGTWTTFTPGVTQSAVLVVTVNWARYRVIGKTAIVQIKLTYSSGASVANNAITITGLPAAIQSARTGAFAQIGTMTFFDSSTNTAYTGFAEASTASTIKGYRDGGTAVGAFGVDPNVAMAASDVVACQLAYEIA